MPRTGGKAKRLTNTSRRRSWPGLGADGKKLLFLSDRNGHEDIFSLESGDDQSIVSSSQTASRSGSDPFGRTHCGRQLCPRRQNGGVVGRPARDHEAGWHRRKVLAKDGTVTDYDWSPDSQWLVYSPHGWFLCQRTVHHPSHGCDRRRSRPQCDTFCHVQLRRHLEPRRQPPRLHQFPPSLLEAYVMSLQKPLGPGSSSSGAAKGIDWDDIHLRVRQPVTSEVSECAISNDGTRIAFRGQESDLWVAQTDGSQLQRLTKGGLAPHADSVVALLTAAEFSSATSPATFASSAPTVTAYPRQVPPRSFPSRPR